MLAKRLAAMLLCCLLSAGSWADQTESEINNVRAEADGPINFDETLFGGLQGDGGAIPEDYWEFTGTAGSTYVFTGIPSGSLPFGQGLDIDLALVNDSGVTLLEARDGVANQNEILSWLCPADGTYFLDVFEGTGQPNNIITYRVLCVRQAPPVNAPVVTILGGGVVAPCDPPTTTTVATVTDVEDADGSLAVSVAGMPPGLTVQARNNGGAIEVVTSATCAVALGRYPITLTVTDSDTNATPATFNVTVTLISTRLAARRWRLYE